MNILVTGALSQIGYELMQQAAGSEHIFIFTDVKESDLVHRLDISDPEDVANYVTPDVDVVVNCAAYTDVNGAESDEEAAMMLNAYAPGLLARAAKEADALLIHFSTDYVFDGTANVPYTEESRPSPVNAYGRSKLAGEREIEASGCRYMIFRTSWLYSPVGKNFFRTITDLTAERPEIKVVFDQAGTPTYAYDLAYLICRILDEGMCDKVGIYNYSNEGICSWYDFAVEINSMMGHTCNVLPCRTDEFPSKAARPHYSVLDKRKVKETFNIEIPHWKQSLYMLSLEYQNTADQ